MGNNASTPGRRYYDDQIAALIDRDIDRIMDQYHPDAVLVGFDFIVRGSEALRRHFIGYLERIGSLELISTDKWAETDDSIFFEATVNTAHGEAKVYDVFMLRDGKCTHQYTGLISFTPFAKT
jgi:hypothetical protein